MTAKKLVNKKSKQFSEQWFCHQFLPQLQYTRFLGDDACDLGTLSSQHTVLAKDLLIEGQHFIRSEYNTLKQIANKALQVNLSDLAAMAAEPQYFLLGLGIPQSTSRAEILSFFSGFEEACLEYNLSLVGGDTVASPLWTISITVIGKSDSTLLTRSGVKVGDWLWMTGNLGQSKLGLEILLSKINIDISMDALSEMELKHVAKHVAPRARVKEAQVLKSTAFVTAMIDLSDGLASELGHLARASRTQDNSIGFRVDLEKIPGLNEFEKYAQAWQLNVDEIVHAGEDYELLFCVDQQEHESFMKKSQEFDFPVTCIGEAIENPCSNSATLLLKDHSNQTKEIIVKEHHF